MAVHCARHGVSCARQAAYLHLVGRRWVREDDIRPLGCALGEPREPLLALPLRLSEEHLASVVRVALGGVMPCAVVALHLRRRQRKHRKQRSHLVHPARWLPRTEEANYHAAIGGRLCALISACNVCDGRQAIV